VALPLLLILVGGCATAEDLTAEDLTFLPSSAAEEAWEALVKGGHVALIRHGNAPPGSGGDPPASGSTTAGRSGTSTTMDAHKERRWAKPSADTACALTGLCPHSSAAAWTRRI